MVSFHKGGDNHLSSIALPAATYSSTFLSMKKVGRKGDFASIANHLLTVLKH